MPTSSPLFDAPDAELCAKACGGDREAWGVLYLRYNGQVVMRLVQRGYNPTAALDHAQQAWTRLMERATRGELGELKVPGLIITTATHLAIDTLRKEGREDELTDGKISARDDRPGDRIDAATRLQRTMEALQRLPRRARELFTTCMVDPDRPQAEIAKEQGVTLQHLRQTLYDVRKKLAEHLERP
jgi:RNA polymerase sigma factor (sigma-70 family)